MSIEIRWLKNSSFSRKIHVFFFFFLKTGTHSLANIFKPYYRSEHEAEMKMLIENIDNYTNGLVDKEGFKKKIMKRDKKLRLEVDVSHALGYAIDSLIECFPEAKYILTVREPYSWLDSIINQHLNYNNPKYDEFRLLRNIYHAKYSTSFSREEKILLSKGLFSLDGYLKYWRFHNLQVLEKIPSENLMVVDISSLSSDKSMNKIAEFIEIPSQSLSKKRRHSYKAIKKHEILSHIPKKYLDYKVLSNCGDLMGLLNDRMLNA